MPHRPELRNWLSLLLLTVLWGSAFMFIKLALVAFPPSIIVAARIAIAAVLVYAYLRITGGSLPTRARAWLPVLVLAILGNVLPFNLIAWAQQHIDSSLAGILMAVMPLFVLTLAHFFVPGERLTRYRTAGFIVGFSGVVIVIGPEFIQGVNRNKALWGAIAVLAAALSYAVSTIYARQLGPGDPVQRSAGMLIVASALTMPAALINLPEIAVPPGLMAMVAIVFLGLLATGLATVIYFRLIQGPGPTFVSFVNYLVPAWAVIAGAVFLDESLSTSVFLGLGLILIGIAVSELGARAVSLTKALLARSVRLLFPIIRNET